MVYQDIGLSCVVFEHADIPMPQDQQFGDPSIFVLGKFWFCYGDPEHPDDKWDGKIQFVNFKRQIFFPEGPNPTGYGWKLDSRVRGKFRNVYGKFGTDPLKIFGERLNLFQGAVGGLAGLSNLGLSPKKPLLIKTGTAAGWGPFPK